MIKTITYELPALSVTLDIPDGLSAKEIQALGEKEVVKRITKNYQLDINTELLKEQ